MELRHRSIDDLNRAAWDEAFRDPQQARDAAQRALREAQTLSYDFGCAEAWLNLGWIAVKAGDYAGGLDAFRAALEAAERGHWPELSSKILNGLGAAYQGLSDYARAGDSFQRALVIAQEHNLPRRAVACLNNLGELNLELQKTEAADEYFRRAFTLAEPLNDAALLAAISGNVAGADLRAGFVEAAQQRLEAGMRAARDAGDRVNEAELLVHFGILAAHRGDREEAERNYQASLRISLEIRSLPTRCLALLHLADVHRANRNDATALPLYKQALETAEAVGSRYLAFRALRQLAEIAEAGGDVHAALEYHKQYTATRIAVLSESAEHRLQNVERLLQAEQLRLAGERMEAVYTIAREITASLDLDEIFDHIYDLVNRIIEAPVLTIALYDEADEELDFRLIIENGERGEPIRMPIAERGSFSAWVARTRGEVIINDMDRDAATYLEAPPRSAGNTSFKPYSMIYLPLVVKDRFVGAFGAQAPRRNAYSELDIRVLRTLAAFVAVAIDNAMIVSRVTVLNRLMHQEKDELQSAYERISYLANHDHLTGIANRRMFFELLELHMQRTAAAGGSLAVLYIDLDRFKPINDQYGHECGDRVLRTIAERLAASCRTGDAVARIGGDEFVVLAPGVRTRAAANAIANKMVARIADPITVADACVTVGASVGVALFPHDAQSAPDLLAAADQAMYLHKAGPLS